MRELVKLRRRFVLILMLSVGLILTIVLLVSVLGSFSTQYTRIQNSLSTALVVEGGEALRPHIGGPGGTFEEEPAFGQSPLNDSIMLDSGKKNEYQALISSQGSIDMVPVYVIDILFETGEKTVYGNYTNMDDATLAIALSRIQSSEENDGLFLDLGLFYKQEAGFDGITRIAFADASQIFDNTLYTGLMALLVWIAAIVVFFFLSLLLSRMVLRPVEEAWTKQREFIADASHELKTPLTVILANNSIMMAHPEKATSDQVQWLESTQEEATRMDGLITDLLLLAQVEHAEEMSEDTGQADVDDLMERGSVSDEADSAGGSESFTNIDLSSLVERSVLQFDAVFFERKISAESEIEPGLSLEGNQEHLRRLVTILLDNASKYGNEGGTVAVQLSRDAHKPKQALLTVSNTGAYIPPEKIESVFDRFFRVDAAHSTAVPGSGLGLALAKEIVSEHGGSISVRSTLLGSDGVKADSLGTGGEQNAELNVCEADELAETTFSVVLPLA